MIWVGLAAVTTALCLMAPCLFINDEDIATTLLHTAFGLLCVAFAVGALLTFAT